MRSLNRFALGSHARDVRRGRRRLHVRLHGAWRGTITVRGHGPCICPRRSTRARDYVPHLSPDGKRLFFSSERSFALDSLERALTYGELVTRLRSTLNGSGNIYEMDSAILDSLHLPQPWARQSAGYASIQSRIGDSMLYARPRRPLTPWTLPASQSLSRLQFPSLNREHHTRVP
jgi:hypothetical protein